MTKPRVPEKFYFKNSAGGDVIYKAERSAGGHYDVIRVAGGKSGLSTSSMAYSREACWGYLYATGEWERVKPPKPEVVKAPEPQLPKFEMRVWHGKEGYSAKDFTGAYEILALLKARDKVEGKLETYRS